MAKPKTKQSGGNGDPPIGIESQRIIYDPLEPQYNALHRAGMAGLALQVKAMEKDNSAPRPKIEWIEGGRTIELTLDLLELRALLQERYLGVEVTQAIQPQKNQKG